MGGSYGFSETLPIVVPALDLFTRLPAKKDQVILTPS